MGALASIVAGAALGHLLLGGVFLYLSLRDPPRARQLRLWACAFGAYAPVLLITPLLLLLESPWPLRLCHATLGVLAVTLVLAAALRTVGREPRGWWWAVLVAVWAYTLVADARGLGFGVVWGPLCLLYAAVEVAIGVTLLRGDRPGLGSRILGGALVVSAIHHLDYPFLGHLAWFVPWGIMVSLLVAMAIATGVLILYFEEATELARLREMQLIRTEKLDAAGRLAAGLAHDLNNVLTAISFSSFTLRRGLAAATAAGEIDAIADAAERGGALLRQMLSFHSAPGHRPRPIDLRACLVQVESLLRAFAGGAVELSLDLGEAPLTIRADPIEVEQVVLNLVANARDAMPQGGLLRVAIRREPSAGSGSSAVLSVADTGIGMTPEVRARIFEPFFTTKESGKGTGLGLMSVQRIVQRLGGAIEVETAVGAGTTVCVRVPVTPEAPPRPAPEPGTAPDLILVVDGDANVRGLLERTLDAAGYEVLACPDGETALKVATEAADRLSLLVIDADLPGLSAGETAHAVSAMAPGAAVLVAGGHAPLQRGEEGPEGWRVLAKPFTPEGFLSAVQRALRVRVPPSALRV